LVFSIQGRFMQRLMGARSLTVAPGDRVTIFRVRWTGPGMGIGIEPEGQRPWYFWIRAGDEILTALRQAGFEIGPERRGWRRT
jgi:hypothetical protein